jgi:hypothetical protein
VTQRIDTQELPQTPLTELRKRFQFKTQPSWCVLNTKLIVTEPFRMSKQILAYTTTLTCHPETLSQTIHDIEVRISWAQHQEESRLVVTYTLAGDCDRLRIPPSRPPTQVDGLWRHTCFEAFISRQGESAYCEYNFSPSGEWAHYYFSSYRNASPPREAESTPTITTSRRKNRIEVNVDLRLPHLSTTQPLRLALSAVIEEQSGVLSYWALKHPPGKPDFHHIEAFALEIHPPYIPTMRRET